MKCQIVLFWAVVALAHSSVLKEQVISYEGYHVFRVETPTKEAFESLSSIANIHFWNEGRVGSHADVMVSPQHVNRIKFTLLGKNLRFTTMIDNVGELIRLEKIPARKKIEGSTKHNMNWDEYHEQDDIEGYLKYLEDTYDFVELEDIGKSYEGRPMTVVKVCKGGCGKKPAMWIDGGIHAREWISPATVTWMMKELIENDADHPELTNGLDWYMLAIVNPDGYYFTSHGNRLWRKTRSPHGLGICKGADANRNFGYKYDTGGSSDLGCDDTYHGEGPFSEVETQHVRDFLLAHKDRVKFFNSIHSYSQLILLPWGFTSENAPGHDNLMNLANEGNKALKAVHGKSYEVGCIPCMLYIASGGSMDWALGEAGIPYSYGMELRDTGLYGFLLPANQIIPTGEETWAFHATAANIIITEFPEPIPK